MPRDSLFEIRQPPIPLIETRRSTSSLREFCVKSLAIHFDLIECAGPLDSGLFAEIVCHPSCQATPQTVIRLEEQHPHLSSSESDDCYWRKRKKCMIAARSGLAPLPLLCTRVSFHQAELERWIGEKSEVPDHTAQGAVPSRLATTPPGKGKSTVSDQSVLRAVESLARIPMPVALLLETKVGKTLSRIVKACRKTNDAVFSSANDLLMRWKRQAQEKDADFILANLGQCETWKQLYILLTNAEDQKKQKFALRAREIAAEAAQAKRSTYRLSSVQIPPSKRQRRQDPHPTLSYSNVSRRIDSSSNTVSPPPATPPKPGFRLNAPRMKVARLSATSHVRKTKSPRSTVR